MKNKWQDKDAKKYIKDYKKTTGNFLTTDDENMPTTLS